jgi:O-antigen/teichoic acid export membrane protein
MTEQEQNRTHTNEPTLKEKTAKGLFWGGFSNIVQQVVGAVLGILIQRQLTSHDYGLIAMIAVFPAIANILMDSGFTTALVNRKAIRHEDYNAVFWFSVSTGLFIYVILFFSAPLIANFYEQPVLTGLSRLYFLCFTISSFGIAHNAILVKKMKVKERAITDITAVSLSGATGLILALNGFAYWGLAVQSVLMGIVSVLFRWYFSKWRPSIDNITFQPLKEMFSFSIKILLTNIVYQFNVNLLSVIYGKLFGSKTTGYYYQGSKWATMGSVVTTGMITAVAQPVFVEVNTEKERQLMVVRKMVRFGAFISFPALLGLAFVAQEFIMIVLPAWEVSIPYMQLFCIWGALGYILNIYFQLLISHGKSGTFLKYQVFMAVSSLLVILALLKVGSLAMAAGYIAVNISGFFLLHHYIQKLIGLRLLHVFKDVAPFLLITLLCFLLTWLLTDWINNLYFRFIAKITVSAILYFLLMKYSKAKIFTESMEFIMSKFKQL